MVKPERLPKSEKEMEFDRLMRQQYAATSSVWINDKGGRKKEFKSLKQKAKLQVKSMFHSAQCTAFCKERLMMNASL